MVVYAIYIQSFDDWLACSLSRAGRPGMLLLFVACCLLLGAQEQSKTRTNTNKNIPAPNTLLGCVVGDVIMTTWFVVVLGLGTIVTGSCRRPVPVRRLGPRALGVRMTITCFPRNPTRRGQGTESRVRFTLYAADIMMSTALRQVNARAFGFE
jgi:hypothetical protein